MTRRGAGGGTFAIGGLVLGVLAAGPAYGAKPADASSVRHEGQNGPLSPQQARVAAAAWRYFENNFRSETCLVDSVEGYPSTTMWDTASALAALVSAHELGLVDAKGFDARLGCMLATLERLPLYQGVLPNKAYHTQTLEEVGYDNAPGEIGVSAIDMGRLLLWLDIVKGRYPTYTDAVDRVVRRWTFCDIVRGDGTLYGAAHGDDGPVWLQEGRLGYEEYAAVGFQLWGFRTDGASRPEPFDQLSVYGVPIAYDARDPKEFGAHNYVITEPYVLLGLELNWDLVGDERRSERRSSDTLNRTLARRVYKAQVRRWRRTGILTARTEHHVPDDPYFVYDTVYTDGLAWNTIGDDGEPHPELAALSTRAAVGLDVLFDTRYTGLLFEAVTPLVDPERGVFEGTWERDGQRVEALTANTNGILLESLLYTQVGKLVRHGVPETAWGPPAAKPEDRRCYPSER